MVVFVRIVLIVEKRAMEEGRPLRLEEGRQQGFVINSQISHRSFRDRILFIHLPSSFVLRRDLHLFSPSNFLTFLTSNLLLLRFQDLGPGVAQCYGPIKYQSIRRRVFPIHTKIPKPFKLVET